MSQEVLVLMSVVVPDGPPDVHSRLQVLLGRALPDLPGSWVTRVAVRALPDRSGAGLNHGNVLAGRRETFELPGGLTADELDAELDADFGVGGPG